MSICHIKNKLNISTIFSHKNYYTFKDFDEYGYLIEYNSTIDADCNAFIIPNDYIRYAKLDSKSSVDEKGYEMGVIGNNVSFGIDSGIPCAICEGQGSYINYNNYLSNLSSYTLSVWIKGVSNSQPAVVCFSGGSWGANGNELKIYCGNTGWVTLNSGGGTPQPNGNFLESNALSGWNHIAYSWSGQEMILYINGKESSRTNAPYTSSGNLYLWINQLYRASSVYGSGKYSSLRLYDRVLTDKQIWALSKEFK